MRETTPVSLPLNLMPGRPEAPGAANDEGGKACVGMAAGGGMAMAGVMVGVGGALDAGLGVSTTHILHPDQ